MVKSQMEGKKEKGDKIKGKYNLYIATAVVALIIGGKDSI